MTAAWRHGPVAVVGSGLIGTSIGLALRRQGADVYLQDVDPAKATLAAELGAGRDVDPPAEIGLVVVAVPPDELAGEILRGLARWPASVVTDVGSVKLAPLRALTGSGYDLARYVGGHPIAGSERSGPRAGAAGLFESRPWAVVPHEASTPAAVRVVDALVLACGARIVRTSAEEHDTAVARTSHLPYVMAVLTAASLSGATPLQSALAGSGFADTTRVADSDPALWSQILRRNAEPVRQLLVDVAADINELLSALTPGAQTRGGNGVLPVLQRGVAGRRAIYPAGDQGHHLDPG
jgi:prephenate dehydrogenase